MVWEVRSGGASTNGGGFKTGATGTDYSLQNGVQYTFTTATTAAANAIFLDAQAAADMVGNILNITGGTNFITGRYEVISVSVGVSMTLDRNCTSAAGASGAAVLGGALDSVKTVSPVIVAGNICYSKYFTETFTTTWSPNPMAGTGFLPIRFVSYDTTRSYDNADANRSTITTATNSTALVTGNATNYVYFSNFIFTNTAATRAKAFDNATAQSFNGIFFNCMFDGFAGVCATTSATASTQIGYSFYFCELKNGTAASPAIEWFPAGGAVYYGCYFHNNAAGAIKTNNTAITMVLIGCVLSNNGGRAINIGTASVAGSVTLIGNSFYNNTTANLDISSITGGSVSVVAYNNIFYGGTLGIKGTASKNTVYFLGGNAFGNNTAYTNFPTGTADITLSADPFTNGADGTGDFSLNSTAGGGALCKSVGLPTVLPGGTTTDYLDVGAMQVQATGGATAFSWSQ